VCAALQHSWLDCTCALALTNVMCAAFVFSGFIIGQEGDSFIVAFREALDAVAFCLQVSSSHCSVEKFSNAAQQHGAPASFYVSQYDKEHCSVYLVLLTAEGCLL
jgi:hypothetical protein